MSITAYKVEAVGHDRMGKDFGYVNIMYRYGDKQRKLPKHLLLQIFPKQKNGHHPQGGAHFLFDSFG